MVASRLVQVVLAFLLAIVPAAAAPVTITGDVFYRERMALPAGSELSVRLVTLVNGKPVVGAQQTIPTKTQSPLAFTLNVRRSLDPSPGTYGLVAEIRHASGVLFETTAPVPLDLSAPTGIKVPVQRAAYMPEPPVTPPPPPAEDPQIIGHTWKATSIAGKPVTTAQAPTLTIAWDLRTSGYGGCNRYISEAMLEGSNLNFGPAAATRMACSQEAMNEESSFFAALAAVSRYEVDETSLRLLDASGIPLIGFVRAKE